MIENTSVDQGINEILSQLDNINRKRRVEEKDKNFQKNNLVYCTQLRRLMSHDLRPIDMRHLQDIAESLS